MLSTDYKYVSVYIIVCTNCSFCMQWVSKAKSVRSEMTAVWEHVNQIKSRMVEMLDSDNDG